MSEEILRVVEGPDLDSVGSEEVGHGSQDGRIVIDETNFLR